MNRIIPKVGLLAVCALVPVSVWGATLTGQITFDGKAEASKPIRMGKDQACVDAYKGKESPLSESLVVGDKGAVKWVFVYIMEMVKGPNAKQTKPVLDQQGCVYHPRVIGIQAGEELTIKNSDETKHNFNLGGKNKYNRSANAGSHISRKIQKAAPLNLKKGKSRVMSRIKCDIHPWMVAWLGVLPHSYFSVTGEAGRFEIPNLPAGDYTLVAWHEKLGTLTQKVSVSGEGVQEVDFVFAK